MDFCSSSPKIFPWTNGQHIHCEMGARRWDLGFLVEYQYNIAEAQIWHLINLMGYEDAVAPRNTRAEKLRC